MDKSSNTADRMRPILAAMERSIDKARRRRLHGGDGETHAIPTPPPGPAQPRPQHNAFDQVVPTRSAHVAGDSTSDRRDSEEPQRLKARPKRDRNLGIDDGYRSKAG